MNPDAYQHHRQPNTPAHRFRGRHIISDQVGQSELQVIWSELERVLKNNVPGDVVEFGCYAGTTSLFIRRLLDEQGESAKRQFHVYDSFEGLPAKSREDESPAGTQFAAGKLSVSKKEFLREFHQASLRPPIVHKGWFSELSETDVPPTIAFAFLDGDFYDSILTSLRLVWPKMSKGSVVLVDDYKRESLPGAERAVTQFLQGKHTTGLRTEAQIAVIRL